MLRRRGLNLLRSPPVVPPPGGALGVAVVAQARCPPALLRRWMPGSGCMSWRSPRFLPPPGPMGRLDSVRRSWRTFPSRASGPAFGSGLVVFAVRRERPWRGRPSCGRGPCSRCRGGPRSCRLVRVVPCRDLLRLSSLSNVQPACRGGSADSLRFTPVAPIGVTAGRFR